MKFLLERLGENIREFRKERGFTLEQLAAESNLSSKYLQRVEKGKRNISVRNLYNIALALSVSLEALVTERNDSARTNATRIKVISEKLGVFDPKQLDMLDDMLANLYNVTPNETKKGNRPSGFIPGTLHIAEPGEDDLDNGAHSKKRAP